MKTRNDFISNSSSCSFIIYPNKTDFITKLCNNLQIKREDIRYMLKYPLSSIPVIIQLEKEYQTKNTFDKIKNIPNARILDSKTGFIIDFIDLFHKDITPDLISTFKTVDLYSYDDVHPNKTPFIHIIYYALKNIGIKVSDEKSERSIEHEESMSSHRLFIHRLCKLAYNSNNDTKNTYKVFDRI